MRDHDEVPYIVIERHGAGFGPFLWGMLIGAGAALLLAPRTGAETRDEIRERVDRARTAATDRVDAARSRVHRTRENIEDRVDAVRDQFGDLRDRIEASAEDARNRIRAERRAATDPYERHAGDSGFDLDAEARVAAGIDREIDIIVTEVSEEIPEGRSDLG
jgi:gas vesicle protein